MLFKNINNEVSHYVTGQPDQVFSPVYIFYSMTQNSNAYINLIKLNAAAIGSEEFVLNDDQKFSVHLDLLGNQSNPFITHKVNLLINAVMNIGLRFSTGNAQEDFTIPNLTLNEVCVLINDPAFQSANVLDTYSTWRVTLMS